MDSSPISYGVFVLIKEITKLIVIDIPCDKYALVNRDCDLTNIDTYLQRHYYLIEIIFWAHVFLIQELIWVKPSN